MLNIYSKNKFSYTSLLDLPKCESSNIWIEVKEEITKEEAQAIEGFYSNSIVHFLQPYGQELINERSSYSYVALTFYDFHFLQQNYPEYIYISGDLLFNVNKLISIKKNTKIISTPAFPMEYFFKKDIALSFIDPQYIYLYNKLIDALDFSFNPTTAQEVLIRHYTDATAIFGDYSILMPFVDIDGRFIDRKFTEDRMNCGRICLSTEKCKKCYIVQKMIERSKKLLQSEEI